MKEMIRVATSAERLAEAMKRARKNQSDLERDTGINRSTISRYVSGDVEPRHDAAHKLSLALNVSEFWLWGYDVPCERPLLQNIDDDELISKVKKLDFEKRQIITAILLSWETTDK